MNTEIHLLHQSGLLAQYFLAALALMGMGLAGVISDQDILSAQNTQSKVV